jgi:hypothetical protein
LEIEDPWGDVSCLNGKSTITGVTRRSLESQLDTNQLLGIDLNRGFRVRHKRRIIDSNLELHGIEERVLEVDTWRLRPSDLEGSFRLRRSAET